MLHHQGLSLLGPKIASSAHVRLVGCSVDRMAAHTKAAPDDSVLRLIDRALGKRNSTVHLHLTPNPEPQLPNPKPQTTHAKATRRSQLRHATEPAPPKIGAGSDSNPSRLRRQSEPAPSSIRAGSDSNPSWLRPLPFPRGIKSPSLRPSKRIHLPLTLAAFFRWLGSIAEQLDEMTRWMLVVRCAFRRILLPDPAMKPLLALK